MISEENAKLSITKQCELLSISRSSYYYKKKPMTAFNLELMEKIDIIHTENITWGSRKIRDKLRNDGYKVNRKRIQRLMHIMQIQVLYPQKITTIPNQYHKKDPYLLRNMDINRTNLVWCTDLTYIRLDHGFVYLTAVMDWYSKKILSYEISNTADRFFCISALESAIRNYGIPAYHNSDQGSQYTAPDYLSVLENSGIQISMNGIGRSTDNIAIERFFRTLKQDEVYLNEYTSLKEAKIRIGKFIEKYNLERPHATHGGKTPDNIYYSGLAGAELSA